MKLSPPRPGSLLLFLGSYSGFPRSRRSEAQTFSQLRIGLAVASRGGLAGKNQLDKSTQNLWDLGIKRMIPILGQVQSCAFFGATWQIGACGKLLLHLGHFVMPGDDPQRWILEFEFAWLVVLAHQTTIQASCHHLLLSRTEDYLSIYLSFFLI